MEKLIYLIYKAEHQPMENFAGELRGSVAEKLVKEPGVRKLRMSIADKTVEPALPLRIQSSPELPDAVLSVWLNTCEMRTPVEAILADSGEHLHGYLVTESEPLVNELHPGKDGERVYGMCQIAIMKKPPRLAYGEWREIWQGSHTQIAIDHQSTFGYRQNVVVRPLTADAREYDAIVEENFPPEAMTSNQVFYDADGDDARLKQNLDVMMESCHRFVDFDKIDAIPMSEYIIRG